jgi:protein ImuB
MGMGEALARCPRLALVPPDPAGVAEAWEALLGRLEGSAPAWRRSGRGSSASPPTGCAACMVDACAG